jgi:3-oxoacyl-[acyl-carrier protein] reductase
MIDFSNKVALVTGATRGIGRSIATHLGKYGATVVGTATSASGVETINTYFKENNIKGTAKILDVCNKDNCLEVIKQIISEFGSLDILVNNAGITKDNLMLRMKDEDWEKVITTNLTSAFYMSKSVIKYMAKNKWGRIINIGSVVGSMGNAGQVNYSAAKAGIEGFTKSLAREMGGRGITVNNIAPGFIDTDMTKNLPENHKEQLLKQIPVGRLGRPEEIAAAVCYLASESAGFINGITLSVNGGMYMG